VGKKRFGVKRKKKMEKFANFANPNKKEAICE
jgi:hypothetical protein